MPLTKVPSELQDQPTIATSQATTSGTTKDFTIPSWATRIHVALRGVSTGGTSDILATRLMLDL